MGKVDAVSEMEKSWAPQNNDALQALDMSQHNSFQHPQRGLKAISAQKNPKQLNSDSAYQHFFWSSTEDI